MASVRDRGQWREREGEMVDENIDEWQIKEKHTMKAHVFITLIKVNPLVRDSTNAQENPKSLHYSCFD